MTTVWHLNVVAGFRRDDDRHGVTIDRRAGRTVDGMGRATEHGAAADRTGEKKRNKSFHEDLQGRPTDVHRPSKRRPTEVPSRQLGDPTLHPMNRI